MRLFKKLTAAVVLAAMSLSLVACGGSKESEKEDVKYGGVIDKLCESKINADIDTFMTLYGSMGDLMESVVSQEVLDETKKTYADACGDNLKVSYEIEEETEATEEDLKGYEETLTLLGSETDLKKAYDLVVDVTVTGSKGSYDYEMILSVGEEAEDGEWIIVNFDDTLLK